MAKKEKEIKGAGDDMEKFQLSKEHIRDIMTHLICVKLLFMYPRHLIENSGTGAWIQVFFMSLIILIIYKITTVIYQKTGLFNILEISEKTGGKALKIFISIFVLISFTLNVSATIRSYPEVVKMVLLPTTPIEIIFLAFGIAVVYAAFCGIGSLAKLHRIFLPLAAGIFLLFFIFLLPKLHTNNLFPFFGNGAKKIFINGLSSLDIFVDLLVLNILLPRCKRVSDVKNAGFFAILVSGLFATLICLLYTLAFPYPMSQNFLYPVYQMARLIKLGEFFQRMEAFFEFIWSLSILLYTAFYLKIICLVIAEAFDLKYDKPLLIPVFSIITYLSFHLGDMRELLYNNGWIGVFLIFVSFFLPFILGGIDIIFKKRGNQLETYD